MDSSESPPKPPVVVLVAEDFFWEKVDSTLRALAKEPVTPDWQGDVSAQVAQVDATAAVVDLENEEIQAIALVKQLRSTEGDAEPLPVLAYASYDREDLLRQAEALGARTVARSTFASSLVRLLQELTADEDSEPENGTDASSGTDG